MSALFLLAFLRQDPFPESERVLEEIPKDVALREILVSPGTWTVAYAGTRNGRAIVAVGGKPIEESDETGSLVLSADGKTVAYRTKRGKSHLVVVGNKVVGSEEWDSTRWVEPPQLSSDGGAFVLRLVDYRGNGGTSVVTQAARTEHPFAGPPAIAPDGSAIAYWANEGGCYKVSFPT